MIKVIIGCLYLLGVAFAVNPSVVTKSARPLLDALESQGEEYIIPYANAAYIPDYGLQVLVTYVRPFDEIDLETLQRILEQLLSGAASNIEGLNKGDWVSIALNAQPPASYLVVRLRPDTPSSLEVWVDGQKVDSQKVDSQKVDSQKVVGQRLE